MCPGSNSWTAAHLRNHRSSSRVTLYPGPLNMTHGTSLECPSNHPCVALDQSSISCTAERGLPLEPIAVTHAEHVRSANAVRRVADSVAVRIHAGVADPAGHGAHGRQRHYVRCIPTATTTWGWHAPTHDAGGSNEGPYMLHGCGMAQMRHPIEFHWSSVYTCFV